MSEQKITKVPIDIPKWVDAARSNPVLYHQRQATEVVLNAIGYSDSLSEHLVLKGGALMALAFKSDRVTGDVDFSTNLAPEDLAGMIKDELDVSIKDACRKLGYLDMLCKVQSVKKRPKPQNFEKLDFPALEISVGYALKGSPQERGFNKGQSAQTIKLEVSFKDQVYQFQELHLFDAHVCVRAFTINELIAEKTRALIQQKAENRDRYRRQDIYDLWFLLENHKGQAEPVSILRILKAKCASRHIEPNSKTLDDDEIYQRAKADWHTIALEVSHLPEFDECYEEVRRFYSSLPW